MCEQSRPLSSQEEIQRYVLFARQFKPRISSASAEYMVEEYKKLRQRDSSGVARSSWRITVRQLESLIRLSEAMARIHCSDEVCVCVCVCVMVCGVGVGLSSCVCVRSRDSPHQVQPKHVKEGFRLLNKSIIRVETPDINFDEEEQIINGGYNELTGRDANITILVVHLCSKRLHKVTDDYSRLHQMTDVHNDRFNLDSSTLDLWRFFLKHRPHTVVYHNNICGG